MEAQIRKVLEDAHELDGDLSDGGQSTLVASICADGDGLPLAVEGDLPPGVSAPLVASLARLAAKGEKAENQEGERPVVVVERRGYQLIVKQQGGVVVGVVKKQSVLPM